MNPIPHSVWPLPFDDGAATRLRERFAAIDPGTSRGTSGGAPRYVPRYVPRGGADPDVQALLQSIGGNSPYLSDLILREPATVTAFLDDGPDTATAAAMERLAKVPASARRERVAAAMRQAKREIALLCALADISGLWRLEQVTGALSALAEATLSLSVDHLLRAAHDAGDLILPDPANPSAGGGFTVLGMGKLGARELNYSSDVDLILLNRACGITRRLDFEQYVVAFCIRTSLWGNMQSVEVQVRSVPFVERIQVMCQWFGR